MSITKRLATLLLVIALLCAALAARAEAPIYTDEIDGFQIALPDGWFASNETAIAEAEEQATFLADDGQTYLVVHFQPVTKWVSVELMMLLLAHDGIEDLRAAFPDISMIDEGSVQPIGGKDFGRQVMTYRVDGAAREVAQYVYCGELSFYILIFTRVGTPESDTTELTGFAEHMLSTFVARSAASQNPAGRIITGPTSPPQ